MNNPIIESNESQNLIINAITKNIPFAVGKIGGYESLAIMNYIRGTKNYPRNIELNAGVFPYSIDTIDRMCNLYLNIIPNFDILTRWQSYNNYITEDIIFNHCKYDKYITENDAVWNIYSPFFVKNNWTNHLDGKKVLVVCAIPNTCEQQFQKLNDIWKGRLFNCKFELSLLKSPYQPQFEKFHNTWFESLEWLKENITNADFDILLAGCGAYGLPLVYHTKKLNKIGIHLGGDIQLLFGIKGRRWDNAIISSLFNDNWIRPLEEETPKNKEIIECGCYW